MAVLDDINNTLTGIWNVSKSTKDSIGNQANKIIEPIVKEINDLKDRLELTIIRKFNNVKKVINNAIAGVKNKLKDIKDDLTSIKNNIKAFINSAFILSNR